MASWTSLPLVEKKIHVPNTFSSESPNLPLLRIDPRKHRGRKVKGGNFLKTFWASFWRWGKRSFISSKNRPFCGKKKRWLIKQPSEFQACQDITGLNGGDDPKTLWCLKINKITLATCSAFLFVLNSLTCFTFHLWWPFTHFLTHSWIYSSTIYWEPPYWMYETRT